MTTQIPRHPIRTVAERTGLTPATLRAWERRYGAVEPNRSPGSQRLYSDSDIQRLRLIARLAAVGYSLAELARATTATLTRMARHTLEDRSANEAELVAGARAAAVVTRLLSDAQALDPIALRSSLTQSVMTLGPAAALDSIVSPFLHQVGVAWACGNVSVAQEHVASAAVRDVLGWLLQTATPAEGSPTLVAGTLAGEQHEFGAMMAAAAAAVIGWRVVYLGPNLPAEEVARAAKESSARVVALGIVTPQPPRTLHDDLTALRRVAGKRVSVVAGGEAAGDHRLTMRQLAIDIADSRTALRPMLDRIWSGA